MVMCANYNMTLHSRLTKTAGMCAMQGTRAKPERTARILLSKKVLDSAERLRDTMIHELCHAASWIISGVQMFTHPQTIL